MLPSLTVGATEFKAKCLDLLDRLADHSLESVRVTKRGKVVAVVTPPPRNSVTVDTLHGCMEGSVLIPPGVDLTAPVFDPDDLSGERGILHT